MVEIHVDVGSSPTFGMCRSSRIWYMHHFQEVGFLRVRIPPAVREHSSIGRAPGFHPGDVGSIPTVRLCTCKQVYCGEVAEWLIASASNTEGLERGPWVQIPASLRPCGPNGRGTVFKKQNGLGSIPSKDIDNLEVWQSGLLHCLGMAEVL